MCNAFAVDELLRKNGFRIWARPKRGEDIWAKNGRYYKFSEACTMVDCNDLSDAQFLEMMEGDFWIYSAETGIWEPKRGKK